MNKKMSRKDFLKHMGAMLIGMVGVGAFLRNITNPLKEVKTVPKAAATNTSYGMGRAYGE